MKFYLSFLLFLSFSTWAAKGFDQSLLQEIEESETMTPRKCQSKNLKLTIENGLVKLQDSTKKLGRYSEYHIYDESSDYILADHMTSTNISYTQKNLIPEIIIAKKGKSVFIIEGLSFKFQKFGVKENCKGRSLKNIHCYSRIHNTNLSSYKNTIKFILGVKKQSRTLAATPKEVIFAADEFDFHGKNLRIGNNGSIKKSIALINSENVLNVIYSFPQAKGKIQNCELKI